MIVLLAGGIGLIIRALVLTHQIRAKKAPAKINSTIPTAPHTNARDIDNVFMRDRPERNTETTAPRRLRMGRSGLKPWPGREVCLCLGSDFRRSIRCVYLKGRRRSYSRPTREATQA
jgi:hypothetical protein